VAERTSGSEGRVGLDKDTLLVAVLLEFVLRVVRVVLDLVHGGNNLPRLGKVLDDGDTGVGDTDGLDLALGKDILHLRPRLLLVPLPVDVSRAVLLDGEELMCAVRGESAADKRKSGGCGGAQNTHTGQWTRYRSR
jgi:hypothetical protein